jgi:hypothetical protein
MFTKSFKKSNKKWGQVTLPKTSLVTLGTFSPLGVKEAFVDAENKEVENFERNCICRDNHCQQIRNWVGQKRMRERCITFSQGRPTDPSLQ